MKVLTTPNTALKHQTVSETRLWNTPAWQAWVNPLWQQAQAWAQPLVDWATGQNHEPLYMQAQADESYLRYMAWRSECKSQLRQLSRTLIALYRQGAIASPEQLTKALIAQQAAFEPAVVSPLYYDHYLTRCAQRLPRYAHTFEGVAAQFRTHLQTQPDLALAYFYHDTAHQLIDSSWYASPESGLAARRQVPLQQVLRYYQALVPSALWQAVQSLLNQTASTYSEKRQKLTALFMQALAVEPAAASESLDLPTLLAGLNQGLRRGWRYLKDHPQTALLGTMVGASAVYKLAQANSLTPASFTGLGPILPPFGSSSAWTALPYTLPLAISYLGQGYSPSSLTHRAAWPVALTVAAQWLALPVAAQGDYLDQNLGRE